MAAWLLSNTGALKQTSRRPITGVNPLEEWARAVAAAGPVAPTELERTMRMDRTPGERLAARILEMNPDFGSAGYLAAAPRKLSALELLERLHTPNAPGPGGRQHIGGVVKAG